MQKLRFGIVGCGVIANDKHIPSLLKQPEAEIVALCDIKVEKAEKTAKKFGLSSAKIYKDYKDLCDDKNIDVVHVCTPNMLHCEITLTAIAAGKHVDCEKPLACNYADALKMVNAAKKAGKKLTCGLQWRFRPNTFYMKDLVEKGFLGEVYYVKSQQLRRNRVPSYGDYTIKALNGGGILMDGGPHSIDLAMWLTNNFKPKSVSGVTLQKMRYEYEANYTGPWDPETYDVEDQAMALLTMENGMVIYIETAWTTHMIQEAPSIVASIAGTKGGVDMVGTGPAPVRVSSFLNGKLATTTPVIFPEPGAPNSYEYEMIHWIDAILHDKEPAVLPEEAATVVQVIEGIYKAAELGQVVYF